MLKISKKLEEFYVEWLSTLMGNNFKNSGKPFVIYFIIDSKLILKIYRNSILE